MEIREVFPREAGTVSGIVRRANVPVAQRFGLDRDNAPSHPSFCTPEWIGSAMDRGERYFVAELSGLPAGCVAYEEAASQAYMNRLAVLPDFQGRGLGRRLVEHVISLARRDGKKKVGIGIIKANLLLKNWYATLGFVPSDTRTFDHLPFDVQLMTFDIADRGQAPAVRP